jgi:hypothetical protein
MSEDNEIGQVISQLAVKLLKKNPELVSLGVEIMKKCQQSENDSGEAGSQTSIATDLGRLLTLWAASANSRSEKKTDQEKSINDFLANTDFGEVLELLEKSEAGLPETMNVFNEALWSYPGKFAAILLMLASLARMGVKGATEVLAPFKKYMGPDLLGDMICTLVKDIKPEEIAKLVDAVGELIRRAHTGSQLLGQGDKSNLEVYLDDVMAAYHRVRDPHLQKMLPVYLGEIRESFAKASARSLTNNQEILLAQLASLGQVQTSDLRVKTARLHAIESVDDEKFGSTIAGTVQEFGMYDAADLVNTICGILNKLHDSRPDLIGSTLSGIVDSISADEVRKTATWLVPDVVNAVKPLIREIKPDLLRGLAELLRNDGYSNDEQDKAMQELRAVLSVSGGER